MELIKRTNGVTNTNIMQGYLIENKGRVVVADRDTKGSVKFEIVLEMNRQSKELISGRIEAISKYNEEGFKYVVGVSPARYATEGLEWYEHKMVDALIKIRRKELNIG